MIQFLNKFIYVLLMAYSTCHDVIATYRRASTIRQFVNQLTLDQHSLFATDFYDMNSKFFFDG